MILLLTFITSVISEIYQKVYFRKNAVTSYINILINITNILNPAKKTDDKGRYINRLKEFVSPLMKRETKGKLVKSYFDELKRRIEYTSNLTQGSAHTDRPILEEA